MALDSHNGAGGISLDAPGFNWKIIGHALHSIGVVDSLPTSVEIQDFFLGWLPHHLPVFKFFGILQSETGESFIHLCFLSRGEFNVSLWIALVVPDLLPNVGKSIKLSNWLCFHDKAEVIINNCVWARALKENLIKLSGKKGIDLIKFLGHSLILRWFWKLGENPAGG